MSTIRTLKLNKDLPYIVGARKEGYWDSVMNIYPTADTSYSITMDAYDGLSAKYSESYQSADTIDFSETILPWKIQYSNLLETSKFCLMPYGGGSTEYYYTYNFDVVGKPTINNTTKVVSDFSTSDHLRLKEPFNPGNSHWEVVVKFKTGSNVTSVQQIFQSCLGTGNDGRYGININIDSSSKFNFFCSSNGSSWLFDEYGTYIVQANTDYIIKIGWTGIEYYLEYSLDGETFIRDVTYSSESAIYSPLIFTYFGVYSSSSFSDRFSGSIDLSETYIKVNDSVWWQPEFTEHSRVVYQNIIETEDKLNATFVGSPTFNTETGIVSGFSASNYVTLGNLSMASYNTWSFETEFTTGELGTTQAIFIEDNTGWNSSVDIGAGKNIHIALSSTHSGNNIGEAGTTTILSSNTTYKIKLEFTGTAYNFYIDDVLDVTITSSTKLSDHVWNIGCSNNSGWPIEFLGSVNLKKTKFTADGVERILYEKVAKQEPNVINGGAQTDGIMTSFINGTGASGTHYDTAITVYKSQDFEGLFKAYLPNTSTRNGNHFIQSIGNGFYVRTDTNSSSCFGVFLANGSERYSSKSLSEGWYYFRLYYNSSTHYIYWYYSTDNSTWTTLYSYNLGSYFIGDNPSAESFTFKLYTGSAYGDGLPFSGYIDFNSCWFKVNNQIVWNGMINSTISLPGCTSNFVDTGAATTLNAFVINNTERVVLTPDNTYGGHRFLGTVSIPAHTAYDYDNGTWTEKS